MSENTSTSERKFTKNTLITFFDMGKYSVLEAWDEEKPETTPKTNFTFDEAYEFVFDKSERDKEKAGREKSDLMRMVSWLKQQREKHQGKGENAEGYEERKTHEYYFDCLDTVILLIEREYKEAN